MASDPFVDHPPHYGGESDPYEHVKVAEAWGLTSSAFLYNCTKYIARCGRKEGAPILRDLQKARWYLDREIQRIQGSLINRPVYDTTPDIPQFLRRPVHTTIEVPDRTHWPTGIAPKFGDRMTYKGHEFIWGVQEDGRGTCWLPCAKTAYAEDRRVPRDPPDDPRAVSTQTCG